MLVFSNQKEKRNPVIKPKYKENTFINNKGKECFKRMNRDLAVALKYLRTEQWVC